MNRFINALILLSMFAVFEACQPPPCHWNNPKKIERYFDHVASKMIAADKKLLKHCSQRGSSTVTEVHLSNTYKLIYPSAGGNAFEVKVRDRVVFVQGQNCNSPVEDVRILPPYVDARSGVYTEETGDLVITFQYKYDRVLGGSSCERPNDDRITLPQGASDNIW